MRTVKGKETDLGLLQVSSLLEGSTILVAGGAHMHKECASFLGNYALTKDVGE